METTILGLGFRFAQVRGTVFRGPYNTECSLSGSIWGSPYLEKLLIRSRNNKQLLGSTGCHLFPAHLAN